MRLLGDNVIRILWLSVAILLLAGCSVGPGDLGISPAKWQFMSETERLQSAQDYRQIHDTWSKMNTTLYNGPAIDVTLSQGGAMMPPFINAYPIRAVSFRMEPGICRSVIVVSVNGNHSVPLKICYNGLTLAMDPSAYNLKKATGTLRFDYTPIWKRGFTYPGVSSKGYVRLNHVNVTIRAATHLAPVEDVNHPST